VTVALFRTSVNKNSIVPKLTGYNQGGGRAHSLLLKYIPLMIQMSINHINSSID